MATITIWNRVEPHRRTDNLVPGLRAEVRDPLWMLTRQWQLGELRGEDAGSPAFVRLVTKTADLVDWRTGSGPPRTLDGSKPLEAAVLAQPHSPLDLATAVELGLTFLELLERQFLPGPVPQALRNNLAQYAPVSAPSPDPDQGIFNPIDRASEEFIDVVAGKALHGGPLLALALADPVVVPASITQDAGEIAKVSEALGELDTWAAATYGSFAAADPEAWDPHHLEYRLEVRAGTGPGQATLRVQPSPRGEIEWSSFDLAAGGDPLASVAAATPQLTIPSRVHYPGMPHNRFWRFEDPNPAYPDVVFEMPELVKAVVVDFAIESGVDWFQVQLPQRVGTVARIESLIVKDVFGRRTVIDRADAPGTPAGLTRWTMYGMTSTAGGLAPFNVVPPSVGDAVSAGLPLEQVRFARDDNANIAWGIEAVLESPVGEPRPGFERNAAVSALLPPPPDSQDTSSPLRYLLESRVPIQWIPLVPDPVQVGSPQIDLVKGAVALPVGTEVRLAKAAGQILNPRAVPPPQEYRIPDEEVPRAGLRVERFLARSRWKDGSSHLWVARRRRTGTGETQAGLVFDAALPVRR